MHDIPFASIVFQSGCADVIFVHGLTGDPAKTWTSTGSKEPEGEYWPRWLAADLPHLNFYAVGYPTSLFQRWARKEMDLFERSKATLEIMASYDLGNRPIVFIGHSLGGLLIKQMLRIARESTEEAWQAIADQCRGVMFLATPHSGSSLANVFKIASLGLSSIQIDKLCADGSELGELNESFRAYCVKQSIVVVAYYEMHKEGNAVLVVEKSSADPGVGSVPPIPVDADHTSICSPQSRHAPVYRSILTRLRKIAPPKDSDVGELSGQDDSLTEHSEFDRRDLQSKMIAAGREHEYPFANLSQNRFARAFERTGLITSTSLYYNKILQDIEQRFQNLVYHPLICNGAAPEAIAHAVQSQVVEPIYEKYSDRSATPTLVMNALYFLTERCHLRWDKP